MNPNERVLMNFRVPAELRKRFAAAAAGRGRSSTAFAKEMMELAVFTDAEFLEKLMELAQVHQDICERGRLEERRRNVE
jgi:predicted DNA-binding protein